MAYLAHNLHSKAALAEHGDRQRIEAPYRSPFSFAGPERLSFGHATTLADLEWLSLVQYIGTATSRGSDWPQLFDRAMAVVTLDPLYGYAYESAGTLLGTIGRVDESNSILDLGLMNVADRWQLPFLRGFNDWYRRGHLASGAEYTLRASVIPGAPRHLPELAARLFSSARSTSDALTVVDATLTLVPRDSSLYTELVSRRRQLEIEHRLQQLEAAIDVYRLRFGATPRSLDALRSAEDGWEPIAAELLLGVEYDPASGAVRSPELEERLKYYRSDLEPLRQGS